MFSRKSEAVVIAWALLLPSAQPALAQGRTILGPIKPIPRLPAPVLAAAPANMPEASAVNPVPSALAAPATLVPSRRNSGQAFEGVSFRAKAALAAAAPLLMGMASDGSQDLASLSAAAGGGWEIPAALAGLGLGAVLYRALPSAKWREIEAWAGGGRQEIDSGLRQAIESRAEAVRLMDGVKSMRRNLEHVALLEAEAGLDPTETLDAAENKARAFPPGPVGAIFLARVGLAKGLLGQDPAPLFRDAKERAEAPVEADDHSLDMDGGLLLHFWAFMAEAELLLDLDFTASLRKAEAAIPNVSYLSTYLRVLEEEVRSAFPLDSETRAAAKDAALRVTHHPGLAFIFDVAAGDARPVDYVRRYTGRLDYDHDLSRAERLLRSSQPALWRAFGIGPKPAGESGLPRSWPLFVLAVGAGILMFLMPLPAMLAGLGLGAAITRKRSGEPDMLSRFMRDVKKYPALGKEEQLELARRYKNNGDIQAAQTLIASNQRFVVGYVLSVARRRKLSPERTMDLIQQANVGLLKKALPKFDPDDGPSFVTYAFHWIRAYVDAELLKHRSLVRHPRSLGYQGVAQDQSLDAPLAEGEAATFQDALPDPDDPERLVLYKNIDDMLDRFGKGLNAKEKVIFEERLLTVGLPVKEEFAANNRLTLEDVGRLLGISRQRVNIIEKEVREKLARFARRHLLVLKGKGTHEDSK